MTINLVSVEDFYKRFQHEGLDLSRADIEDLLLQWINDKDSSFKDWFVKLKLKYPHSTKKNDWKNAISQLDTLYKDARFKFFKSFKKQKHVSELHRFLLNNFIFFKLFVPKRFNNIFDEQLSNSGVVFSWTKFRYVVSAYRLASIDRLVSFEANQANSYYNRIKTYQKYIGEPELIDAEFEALYNEWRPVEVGGGPIV